MQIPGSLPYNSAPSMFEAILEECSVRDIAVELLDENNCVPHLREEEIYGLEKPQPKSISWFWLEEAPFETILEDKEETREDANIEFRRVKSLRQEQESKIAQFLREDKQKSLRNGEPAAKNQSPTNKYSQSLSPKKTKKIDKFKQLKLSHQAI